MRANGFDVAAAYFRTGRKATKVLVQIARTDESASAAMTGFESVTIRSAADGWSIGGFEIEAGARQRVF